VQPLEVCGVGQHDPQQIVVFTRHQVALHHLGHLAHGLLELAQMRLLLAVERDVDEDVHRASGFLLIDERRISLDEARLLERAYAAQAR
jgi:hypothetical protein